jgi:hypothetical protein
MGFGICRDVPLPGLMQRSKYGEIRRSKSAIGQPHADLLQSLHGSPNTCGQAAFGFNGFCLWHTVAIGNYRISVMRRSPGRSRIVSERSLVSIRPARRNADSTRLTWIAPDQVAEILEAAIYGSSEPRYADSAIMSLSSSFSTTCFISSTQGPLRLPIFMSLSWRKM